MIVQTASLHTEHIDISLTIDFTVFNRTNEHNKDYIVYLYSIKHTKVLTYVTQNIRIQIISQMCNTRSLNTVNVSFT